MRKGVLFLLVLLTGFAGCGKKDPAAPVVTPNTFYKGADVGWLTQMEASGIKFHNNNGVEQDLLQILKDKGMNSIRLRAWVHPTDGWNNTADVVVKAKRAKNLGMKIMIDFHYSDTWADPDKQGKPKAWTNFGIDSLTANVYRYTKGVMDTLKLNGITPDWVQVGNETNDGMLWEDGKASKNMANFAALVKAGYKGVKEVSSTSQVIVHLSNGFDNGLFRWMFDGLTSNGANFDIIGMSLYPSYASGGASDWSTVNTQCLNNMNDMVARYNKSVMVVEVGMPANKPDLAKAFLQDILSKTKSVTGGKGLGVFYWEPECYANWQGYGLGAFDDTGKPSSALDAFMDN
jgi:arabinogalactan endo-1,4-beta-galactosidase